MAGMLNRAAGSAFSTAFRVVRPMTQAGLSFTWSAGKTLGKTGYRLAPDMVRMGMSYGASAFETIAARPGMVMGLGATAAVTGFVSEGTGHNRSQNLSTENQTAMARYYNKSSTGFQTGMGATRESFQPIGPGRQFFPAGVGPGREFLQQSAEGLTLGLHRARHR